MSSATDTNMMALGAVTFLSLLVGGVALKVVTDHNYVLSKKFKYDNLWGSTVELSIPTENFPTEKERAAMDVLMSKSTHGWYTTTDGVKLHYRKFVPKQKPAKAIIVHQHGIQDHVGNAYITPDGRKLGMALMEDYCDKNGYAFYCVDMQGHGFSEGTRMYVDSWQRNRDHLMGFAGFAVSEHPDRVPFFLMGHSYGGCLTLHAGYEWEKQAASTDKTSGGMPKSFAGLIVLAPAIVGDLPPPPVVWLLKDVLAARYPQWIPFFMPNPVSADRIWRDEYVLQQQRLPTKQKWGIDGTGNPFCLHTAVELLGALNEVRDTAIPKLSLPLCSLQGSKDYAVVVESTTFLKKNVATPKEDSIIELVDGAYHDLLADPCAEQVIKTIDGFVKDRIGKLQNKK